MKKPFDEPLFKFFFEPIVRTAAHCKCDGFVLAGICAVLALISVWQSMELHLTYYAEMCALPTFGLMWLVGTLALTIAHRGDVVGRRGLNPLRDRPRVRLIALSGYLVALTWSYAVGGSHALAVDGTSATLVLFFLYFLSSDMPRCSRK